MRRISFAVYFRSVALSILRNRRFIFKMPLADLVLTSCFWPSQATLFFTFDRYARHVGAYGVPRANRYHLDGFYRRYLGRLGRR